LFVMDNIVAAVFGLRVKLPPDSIVRSPPTIFRNVPSCNPGDIVSEPPDSIVRLSANISDGLAQVRWPVIEPL